MDHSYIDEQQVAERYLTHSLNEEHLASFSNHSAWCEECQDRLQLAEMWLAEQSQPKAEPAFAAPATLTITTPMETAFAEAGPTITVPKIIVRENVRENTVQESALPQHEDAEPEPAKPAGSKTATGEHQHQTRSLSLVLIRRPQPSWQLPALVNMATALSVALEIIRGQQEQLASRAQQRWRAEEIPPVARFVMQFEPWQLAALGTVAAMLLVLMPATLFVWELRQILIQR